MSEDVKENCLEGEHRLNGGIEIVPANKTSSLAYKTYKYRWVILFLYALCCFASALQWPLYGIIADVLVDYYGVSFNAINWTGIVFLFWYIVCVYPGTYFIEKWGLRTAILIGSFGGCVGAWIKLASVKNDCFWVLLLGQSVVAITQTLLTSVPAALAATWFGPEQVSTACSIGVFGLQLGVAFGCLVPPMIVPSKKSADETKQGLHNLVVGIGAVCTVVFLITLIGIRDKPPTPPSRAQLTLKRDSVGVTKSVKHLAKDIPFVTFLFAYGLSTGMFFGLCFLVNQMLLVVYQDASLDVGRIGMLFVVAGVIGCLVFGVVLDKYRKFKQTTLFIFSISTITMIVFALCINQGIAVQYATVAIYGFFGNVVISLGLEVGAEITYPEPVSVSSGILLIFAKAFGIAFVHLYSFLLDNFGGSWPHLIMSGLGLVGTVVVFFTPFDLKRQKAEVPTPII